MNHKEMWEQVKTKLMGETIDPIIFNTYIKNTNVHSITNNNECIILVRSGFAKEILTKNLTNKIQIIINQVSNRQLSVKFLEQYEIENMPHQQYDECDDNLKSNKKKFTFTNFVKGACNQDAYQASLAVVKNLGVSWNPLFIYGNSGLGKTHLLHAVENEIIKNNPNIKIRYLSSEEFGRMFLEIYNHGIDAIEDFKDSFNNYQVLLIDDIQLLAKRNKTNEIFFNIFNRFIDDNKQIILTSDKYPDELDGFEQRMVSRFQSGLSVCLDAPDFETALNILNLKVKEVNYNATVFAKEVLEFIALNFNTDVRKLEGALNRMIFFSVMNISAEKIIELEDVKEAFKSSNIIIDKREKITIKKIKQIVAEYYNIPVKLLISKTRVANITIARHLAMFLARTLIDEPFSRIGIEFGGKDHSTVMNACQKIEILIKNNKEFAKVVHLLIAKCQG